MEKETMHIKIDKLDGSELIVRHGQALPLSNPIPLVFNGDLKCVRAYLDKHTNDALKNFIDPSLAVILVNRNKCTVQLQTAPQNAYGSKITGKLDLSDELNVFGINPDTANWGREALVKILRFNSMFFSDKEEWEKVLSAVQKFSISSNTQLNANSDNRGNKSLGLEKKVNWDGPESFKLNIPIYKGYDKKTFRVDICVDTTDAGVKFWLESVELAELMISERDALMDEQLKGLSDTYVVMCE